MHNVVIIILDSVRKDLFDKHASRLRSLADIEIDRCYAPSSWSVPSHASFLTGELPHQHGVHSYNPQYDTLDGTFLDELPHTSIGLSANGAFSEAFGADALFDEFDSFAGNDEYSPAAVSFKEVPDDVTGSRRILAYLRRARRTGALRESVINGLYVKLTNALSGTPVPGIGDFGAKQLIQESKRRVLDQEPFVLVNNFIDAHGPMENCRVLDSTVPYSWTSSTLDSSALRADPGAHAADLQNYRDLYAANIEYLDRKVAAYIETLQHETASPTSVIVTADHGEELLFDGEEDLGHMGFSSALLHVPCLLINADGPTPEGLTSLLDMGTIASSLASNGTVSDISRERVPAERLGMLFYDGSDEYWRRAIRTVYRSHARYEIDSLGMTRRVDVSASRDGTEAATDLPDWVANEFEVDLETALSTAKRRSTEADVNEATKRQLSDLGYTM